jgi:3-hydroxyacyl-[acyl-carrier protein] dehydratase/trans-2-decenoyl-[acyl-carrier protein] isomerase
VKPAARRVTYHVHMKRLIQRKLFMGIADATMAVDGNPIYTAGGLRVGLFTNSFESTP